MNWQIFEDNMRESAASHEVPVDHEVLWRNIQRKKRRRRGIIICWLSGGAGVAATALWLVIQTSGKPHLETVQTMETMTATAPVGLPAPAPAGSPESLIQTDNTLKNKETNPGEPTAPANFNDILSTKQRNTNNAELYRTTSDLMPGKHEIFQDYPDENQNNFSGQNDIQKIENQTIEFANGRFDTFGILLLPTVPPANKRWLLADLRPMVNQPVPSSFDHPAASADSPKKEKHKNSFDAGLEAGYLAMQVKRAETGTSNFSRNGERVLESASLGIRGTVKVARNFSVKTGVQYSRFTAVYDWQESWDTLSRRLTTITYIDGTTVSFYNGATSLHQFTYVVKNYNRIHLLEIPVDFLYSFGSGRWSVAPFVGIQAGYAFAAKGVIEGKNNKPDKNIYAGIYRNTFTISGRGGVYCAYQLNEKLKLTVAPTAVFDLTGRVKSRDFAQEKFRQVGLNVGLVRRFGV